MSSTVVVVRKPEELRAACNAARAAHPRARPHAVGFVPTMGALHEGHLALVDEARRRAEFVAVSIFVNPRQFGPNEDFSRYPRDLERDCALLAPHGVDLVFAPEPNAMYPMGDATRVHVGPLATPLCGPFRPGHFEGVATVVTKLFGLVGPSVAVFGRKDYQQLAIVRRLVRDLFAPIDVVGHPIIREPDGLAMSSRNAYLSLEERARALAISRSLSKAARAFEAGERNANVLGELVRREIASAADRIDYVEVSDPDSLASLSGQSLDARALVAVACHVGRTRLIDNIVLGEDPAPVSVDADGAGKV